MTESALRVDNLTSGYGELTVLREVTLGVKPGEVLGVVGRNGAGKTALLRAIVGLNRVHAGSVSLDGVSLGNRRAARRAADGIAFVQEGKRVFRRRTVEENLVIGAYTARFGRAKMQAQIDAAYDRFPFLRERRNEPAAALSGGQQQMLAIASALMPRPSYVLLDEPTAGLAPTIVGDILETVRQLRADGIGVVLVEQSIEFALACADRLVVLDLGRVVERVDADAPGVRATIADAYFARTL
ncbi:ABC transporter ATP-binding protein [Dactylosporangium sp. AC04546]|uniref:ABC transporter ATP-binding protein n=1 Tax=Dactylosporangium sp. AC04546 TaxID=2862460 RepID=UPI001EDEFE52|nr:ABC transporter ATP-binding protein [Dactylosporangium sp. AC04546]WVK86834.1 ABC transporter ATP-binding protein [Dactylosporangium sp. AC04546]